MCHKADISSCFRLFPFCFALVVVKDFFFFFLIFLLLNLSANYDGPSLGDFAVISTSLALFKVFVDALTSFPV